ncbi:hypothetical protein D9M71_529870 [compost metagenome]
MPGENHGRIQRAPDSVHPARPRRAVAGCQAVDRSCRGSEGGDRRPQPGPGQRQGCPRPGQWPGQYQAQHRADRGDHQPGQRLHRRSARRPGQEPRQRRLGAITEGGRTRSLPAQPRPGPTQGPAGRSGEGGPGCRHRHIQPGRRGEAPGGGDRQDQGGDCRKQPATARASARASQGRGERD